MTDRKLRGVCVGAGYFSRFQYESWSKTPEVEIVACCNRSLDKAEAMAKDFSIPNVYGIDAFGEMLDEEKPNFVDIITPPETHLALCRIAAEKGIDIICQKPVAPTWQEVLEIKSLLGKHPVRLMVHENWRWQPWYREIKAFMESGKLGDFYHCTVLCRMGDGWGEDAYLARQPFFRDYKRLFIYETGVHFLDTFRYLFGPVDSIYSRIARRNPVIKGEDSALLVCNFKNGGTAVLDANRYNESQAENARYTFGTVRIDGSKGHLFLNYDGGITFMPLGGEPEELQYSPSKEGFAGNCVHAVQSHFVDCMLNDKEFESTLDDYMHSICLVEAGYESALSNTVIPLTDYTPAK